MAPIIIEALEGHTALRVATRDAEGARADTFKADTINIRVGWHDDAVIFCQNKGELRITSVKMEADRRRVHHFGTLYLLRGKITPTMQFEGRSHIIRGHDASVMKANPLTDGDFPNLERGIRGFNTGGEFKLKL